MFHEMSSMTASADIWMAFLLSALSSDKDVIEYYVLLLQQVLLFIISIEYHNSFRNKNNLISKAILPPNLSPWQHLYNNENGSSVLLMTGVTCLIFPMLIDIIYMQDEMLLYEIM